MNEKGRRKKLRINVTQMPISVKWLNVITQRDEQDSEGLEREMEDALYCPECLPSCVDTQYQMTLVTLNMDKYFTSPTNNSA